MWLWSAPTEDCDASASAGLRAVPAGTRLTMTDFDVGVLLPVAVEVERDEWIGFGVVDGRPKARRMLTQDRLTEILNLAKWAPKS